MSNITVIMHEDNGMAKDISIPSEVTADSLLTALNGAYRTGKKQAVAIRTENPLAYLCGNTKVEDAGLHDGSDIYFVED